MIKLSANLNKIALIRNSRTGDYPSVTAHARICIAAGADGITVHPRPDQRHIRPADVHELAALVKASPQVEFNIEGNPFAEPEGDYPGLLELVRATGPDQCTLVPDSRHQLTSDQGFDLRAAGAALRPVIAQLKALGVRVSLFMDPDRAQIELAAQLGAERIELYTGPFAAAWRDPAMAAPLFEIYRAAASHATACGLGINAGHDLNLDNLGKFATIPGLLEVSIGHALIVDALAMGLANAVAAYRRVLATSSP